MQLVGLVLVGTIAMLATPINGCKCLNYGRTKNNVATRECCSSLDGTFQYGEDCKASSISERLQQFDRCCDMKRTSSDCHYP